MSYQSQPLRSSRGSSLFLTVAISTVAAIAAFGSAVLGLAPWAMFVGWVAYFTRPSSFLEGAQTGLSLWLGIGAGALAMLAIGGLMPIMGPIALLLIVFIVAVIVVSMRLVPVVNNTLPGSLA